MYSYMTYAMFSTDRAQSSPLFSGAVSCQASLQE